MSELPAHITTQTETTTTTKFKCHQCGGRILLGDFTLRQPGHEQSLVAWLARHRHGVEEPP